MKRALLISLCLILCFSMSGCKKSSREENRKENSAGSGYGVSQKSIIGINDLYFFSVNTTKEQVLAALGSPQKYTIAAEGAVSYLLETGATLQLIYDDRDVVKSAIYTDESGKEQNLFTFLVEQGVLESAGATSNHQNTGVGDQATQAGGTGNAVKNPASDPTGGNEAGGEATEKNPTAGNKAPGADGADEQYFATERYSLDIASKLLVAGAKRQKILSALGKPNGYSSISFERESYLIDVYYMQNGSVYYLDYGYARESLRAVRVVKGSSVTVLFGKWGQEEKPKDFFYATRNLTGFSSLKKGARPSEIYRRFGDPDWYEGSASGYKDAYQLMGGAVLYLDFGAGHSGLKSATVRQKNGAIIPYTLR